MYQQPLTSTDPIKIAKREAEEYKQDWTPNYNVPCRQEYYYLNEKDFQVEVIQEPNNPKIACRFSSLAGAKAFRLTLLAEDICDKETTIAPDYSYRKHSEFRGQTAYTLHLKKEDYENLLGFQSGSFVVEDEPLNDAEDDAAPLSYSPTPNSGYLTSVEEESEVDSEEEKGVQTKKPSLAIYQTFGCAVQDSIKPKILVTREEEEEEEASVVDSHEKDGEKTPTVLKP